MTSATMAINGPTEIVLLVISIFVVLGLPVALVVGLWMWQRGHYICGIDTYNETGGLRWGSTFLRAMNVSWPFARLHASQDEIRIDISFPWERTFRFSRREIRTLRRTRGWFSIGLRIEHEHADYPPWVLFWTFRYRTLKAALERLGYAVLDS